MLNSWSEANKVTSRGLQIQYVMAAVGRHGGVMVYEYHRLASKAYGYVGMDEATAKMCQAAMLAQYTRTFTQYYNENGAAIFARSTRCVANVEMSHTDAGLWSVNITVSEDQKQYYPGYVADPAALGLFDLSLDYGEATPEGGCICITSASVDDLSRRLTLEYSQLIQGFTLDNLTAEYSADSGATWTAATPNTKTASAVAFVNGSWSAGLFRLKYGSFVSNAEHTPSVTYDNTLALYEPYFQMDCWRMQYDADFADFDPAALRVYYKAADAASFADITDQCGVSAERITTPLTDRTDAGYFKAVYGTVESNTVATPYDPAADVGDGSLKVLGAEVYSPDCYYYLDISGVTDFDAAKVTAKVSADGITWAALTVAAQAYTMPATIKAFSSSGVPASTQYIKFFYDGVQATAGFALPYPETGKIWPLGLTFSSNPAGDYITKARLGQSIDGYDSSLVSMEVSTDGGGTWTAVAGSVDATGINFRFTDGLTDTNARQFRFSYDGGAAVSRVIAYPLA